MPIISVVIGEGGSGGALAIGCANRNLIMENSVYYVASPEACAAILWKSRDAIHLVRACVCTTWLPQRRVPPFCGRAGTPSTAWVQLCLCSCILRGLKRGMWILW